MTNAPLGSYNAQKYALKIGETANCQITGATDVTGTTTTVTIQSSQSGNTDVVGSVSGSTISFSWTAPAGGCDTVVVSWQGAAGKHNIASDPGGFGYVDANGDHVNCGGSNPPDVGITKSDDTAHSVA
ncbi:MAG TPA: hypothetical protein VFY10_00330, partial [Dehalococcoidia bacterium]|nr:hypothetical protein [Dehalococcoidia bacterium]